MNYTNEFQRFKNGLFYYIMFNRDGVIISATIYIDEIRRDVDVTDFVKKDDYWQGRVDEYLAENDATFVERKYFKAHKDVSNG